MTNYGAANVARMTASCLSQLRAMTRGPAEKISFMIDGLHHKLATIGAPSRLLQQPSFPEKKTRAPIHFPCLFVDSPAKLVTTYILLSRQLYSSPICYFFLHNRGMFLYVVYSLTASFLGVKLATFRHQVSPPKIKH